MSHRQVTKLEKAKVQLVISQPFFSSILLKRGLQPRNDIPTMGVNARGEIFYNEKWVEQRSVDELVFVLAHEVGHVIGMHAARLGKRDHKRWNIAGDAWINDMLKAANIGQFVEGGVDMPGSKDRTVDEIYNELPEPPEGGGKGQGQGGPGGVGDDLLDEGDPLTPEELEKLDAETRVEIAQAAQAAKMQGKMPAALEKIVADLIGTKVAWWDVLERHMTSFVKADYSWARPNKRYASYAYLPSSGKLPTMGKLVVQVDVSGSISKAELDHYNGHLKGIVEQCRPEEVHVLYVDTRVCKHEVFTIDEEFGLEFYSGGGTDMEAGFEYMDKEGIEAEVVVVLTDGFTSYDHARAPACPVVWCVSTDQTPTYGEIVRFSIVED